MSVDLLVVPGDCHSISSSPRSPTHSFISGITLLGLPTEVYSYGIQYVYVMFGVIAMGLVMSYVYLPVFHNLHITSTYEVKWRLISV